MQAKRAIGLLGGSFNPAHKGHVHLSKEARKRLGLDEIWWLVSPHNPHKNAADLADYDARVKGAERITQDIPYIEVSRFEKTNRTQYTADTIRLLKRRYPHLQFVWLMGADNLKSFHRWQEWETIASAVPFAVFDRAPFSHDSLRAPAVIRYWSQRIKENQLLALKSMETPAWAYIHMPRINISATEIREKRLGLGEK